MCTGSFCSGLALSKGSGAGPKAPISTALFLPRRSVELRLFRVLHDRIGLILTCYGLVFYVATYYIHSLWT
ncbi:hypothetical protein DAEQUDRAFT_727288 [Daedalea quercina L-15889]|uniref:Uncharacterized protein n=1 Tax=Daedalea quercina L-15889 TaxID=1314783 RepID=A0A165Q0T3_9APHY|nr:hypothetical protein DAEQUDRAFT_727288 [Daedalea quercina L-15889]